jgi:hypothetical protein
MRANYRLYQLLLFAQLLCRINVLVFHCHTRTPRDDTMTPKIFKKTLYDLFGNYVPIRGPNVLQLK